MRNTTHYSNKYYFEYFENQLSLILNKFLQDHYKIIMSLTLLLLEVSNQKDNFEDLSFHKYQNFCRQLHTPKFAFLNHTFPSINSKVYHTLSQNLNHLLQIHQRFLFVLYHLHLNNNELELS